MTTERMREIALGNGALRLERDGLKWKIMSLFADIARNEKSLDEAVELLTDLGCMRYI